MPVTAAERELQLKAVEAALTVRAATDPQRQREAEADLARSVAGLSDQGLWDLRRALDLVESELSGASWMRGQKRA